MDDPNVPEPIAIIGSGCRLPGSSSSPSKLWDLLSKPRDVIRKVDRFNIDGFYNKDPNHHGATNVRQSYLLDEDVRLFDPGFFGIKPVEAEAIDPLQRLVLETVYESLENGGLPLEGLQGSDTAFYVGIMAADFQDLQLRDIENLPTYFGTGTSRSIIANRVSYAFDWHGPSMTIDTACSSSMLALHHAVQTLRRGESSVAVAAGGNLILGPEIYIAESKLNMLSSQGRSAMWDADVDGYGRGEGFVSVVLKRLSDAIRDGNSIDCVIRETRSNQDGRTKGITMPSATAQTQLINDTYAGVGYDLRNPRHRPQFFEAHGTGTKAGDPIEAEAIYNAFFSSGTEALRDSPLYVGSIKTVVGHTEGTAGLAGVLKASLALQAGVVPPNMLFNRLNPTITPYYGPLQITTEPLPWPTLPKGVPRRASVNSFGFGGSNAHAILESYMPTTPLSNGDASHSPLIVTPFLFSAASESALRRTLCAYRDYLVRYPDVDLADLAWTLRSKRSALAVKVAISASSVDELIGKIDENLRRVDDDPGSSLGVRSVSGHGRILGVFTGQGAQWARMGAQLIQELPFAKKLAREMDDSLQDLPKLYRPSWSLVDELSRDPATSRLQEAAFSQPICTLVQVILVELLKVDGIHFAAVVGHSSGEIGAAYASGFLSATDAIKIAHLRGYHSHLAEGPHGEKGAMMAVGTSIEDADDLCSLPDFEGRLVLAASNSSSSVTLSGDSGAVSHAKVVFDDERKFARLLKVDTAYHSHHMKPCAEPYLRSMEEAGIRVQQPSEGSCSWYSSVHHGAKVSTDHALGAAYWRDNMANAVLFSQALTVAANDGGPFHLALEVGPHPALKGPASQTLQEAGSDIPYFGTLKRNQADIKSISECLAGIWSHLGASAVDLEAAQGLVPDSPQPRLLKNLPVYPWDHDKPYWYESRKSRLFRSRARPSHELLGVRCDEGNENELRWRNFISVQEVPWLEGHQVQNQTVFPAAGYVSMALEAAMAMAGDRSVQLLELEDLVLDKAILFHDEKTPVEVMVTLANVVTDEDGPEDDGAVITADFTVSCHLTRDQDTLTKVASGKVKVTAGPTSQTPELSPRPPKPPHLVEVDSDKFYGCLESCGYGYTGPFRALSSLERRYNFCTGLVQRPAAISADEALLVHPALLDPAFQAVLGGYFWPGDGRLWSLFLPTSIRKITVSPSLCRRDDVTQDIKLPFDAWLSESPAREIKGDVSIFSGSAEPSIQVEGLSMLAITDAVKDDDRPFFAETMWGVASPDGNLAVGNERASAYELELATACERVSYYYWRKLEETLTPKERDGCEVHHKQLLETIAHSFEQINSGRHPHVKTEWKNDDEDTITELTDRFTAAVDIRLQTSVGKALPAVLRGETTMLEHMLPDNMLDDFYTHGLGFATYNQYLARMISQLAHRYPRMKFIEIGAGTGGATSAVLETLDSAYLSYTFTDISSGFFEKAAERFKREGDKLVFKALDVERPPSDQGYTPGSYDVVIASNVLHATANLHNTLTNARTLLKPGGYLFLLEITDNTPLRLGFTMGGLPGWWLGAADGRPYSPCISASRWNRVLRETGFSGVDAITPRRDSLPHPFSIMASQAVDERVEQLRRPLFRGQEQGRWGTIYSLGGRELETCHLVEDVLDTVRHRYESVVALETLDDIHSIEFTAHATVVSFLDLDGPMLHDMTPSELKGLQTVLGSAGNLLWVTQCAQDNNPYSNATLGLLRSVTAEIPTLRSQVLDFDGAEDPRLHARVCVEALLRLEATGPWENDPALKEKLLWSIEPEISYKDGQLQVPRIMPQVQHNDRLNGLRRVIQDKVRENTKVQLSREDGSWALREQYGPLALPSDTPTPLIAVKVSHASSRAHRAGDGTFLFLLAGQCVDTDTWVLALAEERASIVQVPENSVFKLPDVAEAPGAFLCGFVTQLVADHIASLATTGDLLLVNEPTPLLAAALLRESQAHGFEVRFVTQDPTRSGKEWVHLNPRQSSRMIRMTLPKDIAIFVDMAPSNSRGLGSLIEYALPPQSVVEHLDAFVQECAVTSSRPPEAPRKILKQVISKVSQTAEHTESLTTTTLQPAALSQDVKLLQPFSVLEWKLRDNVTPEVAKVQPEKLFKGDRTYLLVGLTGAVGRSLCQWMARCGAGAVVLASRNPQIEQAWIDELEHAGTKIKVLALDATNRDAWVRFRTELERDFPPLAGITNGAMVLHDQFFMDMDVTNLNKVLGPKVDASVHLDSVFSDVSLDFFVMFSSLASIVGNRGQSNYAAANTFMASLARQRRSRGQPGSVIGIGRLVGIGYLERVQEVVVQQLVKYGFMPISEVDLHHLFAQAILTGLPDSGEDPEIITALRPVWQDEEMQVPWYNNPRFSHMVLPPKTQRDATDEKKAILSVRELLAAATSTEGACTALEECFAAKLQIILQMPATDFRAEAALIELGVDSLVAVEIRSWFLKEASVDVAVLKILGGASTVELCKHAVEQMPKDLLRSVGTADKPSLDVGNGIARTNGSMGQAIDSSTATNGVHTNGAVSPAKGKTPIKPVPVVDAAEGDSAANSGFMGISAPSHMNGHAHAGVTSKSNGMPTNTNGHDTIRGVAQLSVEKALSNGGLNGATLRTPSRSVSASALSTISEFTPSEPTPPSSSADSDDNGPVADEVKPVTEKVVRTSDTKPVVHDVRQAPTVKRHVKISASQARFWFLNLYMEDQTTSNVTFSYRIKGRVRALGLSRAVEAVSQAHESLKTCFMAAETSSETGLQGIMETSKLKLEHRAVANEDEVAAEYTGVRNTVYDLAQGETMRVVLLSLSSTSHVIIFGYHHIIMDGVGFQIFLRGLEQSYSGQALAAPELQYTTYTEAQRRRIETGALEKSLGYWTQEFANMPPVLPLLPFSKVSSRRAMSEYKSCHVQTRLDATFVHRIKALCRESRVTPSHFYLSTFRVLLSRLSGVKNICIGLADANRNESHAMSALGLFLNLLPIHLRGSMSTPFQAVLQETRNKVYEALGHSDVPFDELLRALGISRSSAHNPLFQAFFDYRQGAQEKLKFGDLDFEVGDAHLGEMAYDMILDVTEGSAGSLVVLRGQEYLYGPSEMQLLLDSYLNLLETFSQNVKAQPNEVKLFADSQVNAALKAGRGPNITYQWPPTVGHRVQDICGQYPMYTAVSDGLGTTISYRDLASRARAISKKLVAEGVKPGYRVAVFQRPTSDWVCSMLAILWTGAVYVPLDMRNPLPRLATIVESAAPSAILAHNMTLNLAPRLGHSQARIVNVDALPAVTHVSHQVIPVSADDAAMILFTSGSTGTPKGLVVRHGNLARHLESYVKAWDISQEVVLQQSAFSFDLSLAQIFTALTMGGQLVMVSEDKRGDSLEVARIIREERVTYTFATPSEYTSWRQFGGEDLRLASSWNLALSGGERLTTELVRLFAKTDNRRVRVLNTYGPAETIISATMTEIPFRSWEGEDDTPVPVGTPLPNYRIYVVDDDLNILPRGYRGEVVIGGPAPVKGYLNNEDLTRQHFITDPFAMEDDKTKGWIVAYRTGDIGRFTQDGVLLFEGRRGGDTQVKLRGIRVDILDIETTLISHSDGVISNAAVSVRTEAQIIVAHVEFSTGRRPSDASDYLRQLVAKLPLPPYMQPAIAIPVDNMPLNVHGKKDRAAVSKLPLPEWLPSPGQNVALTALQTRLAQAWRDVLPPDFAALFDISPDTDFFTVGGNSLLLVKLQARVRETFGISLPLKGMFDESSLRDMATRIETSGVISNDIDWVEETRLDCNDMLAVKGKPAGTSAKKTILLTGATGYLGSYILRQLHRDPSVDAVHCIAVRTQDGDLVSARLPRSSMVKTVGHAGDLTAPLLGLSLDTFERLAKEADVVIHCGARRSFWDSYHQLKAVNFTSTRELVKLAAPRRVPIHFISSSGAMLLNGKASGNGPLSVSSSTPPRDGEEGYVASKWASEAYLEKAATHLGIPVMIHRFGSQTDESGTAKGNNNVVLRELLACSLELGVRPDRSTWSGRFDLIHTETLARQISSSALCDATDTLEDSQAGSTFIHHPSEVSLQTAEVFSFLENGVDGKIMRTLPALEWVGEIKKIGFGYLFASHDVTIGDHSGSGTRLVSRR